MPKRQCFQGMKIGNKTWIEGRNTMFHCELALTLGAVGGTYHHTIQLVPLLIGMVPPYHRHYSSMIDAKGR